MDTNSGNEENARLLVPEQAEGRRLDDVLRLLLPQSGRRRIQQLIRKRGVRVQGRRQPKGYRVRAGQEITFDPLETQAADYGEDLLHKVFVVQTGRDFAAVSKPAGVHSQSLWSSPHPAVEHALPRLFPGQEAFLLNRLDLYTSGLVLVGLNPRAAEKYSRMQDRGETVKTYLAVVQGRVRTEKVLRAALATAKRRKVRVLREMELNSLRWTVVRPVKYVKSSQSSLVQVEIKKGRRHQIRAHLAAWGHPLVGDEVYAQDTQGPFFLHHWKICLPGFEAEAAPYSAKWDTHLQHLKSIQYVHGDMMKIQIRCYATLAKYQPGSADEYTLEPGTTVSDLAVQLGADLDEIKVAFVNGKHAPMSTELQDGDRVALFPAVGGG